MNCSICHSNKFEDFNSRLNARCKGCDSLERHRAVYTVIKNKNIVNSNSTILHLAPDLCLVNKFKHVVKSENYLLADNDVKLYKEAFNLDCVKIDLTKKLPFDANIFDLIVHNHVLEHLTGNHIDQLNEMVRIVKPNGYVIFTIPFLRHIKNTVIGGELLSSDEERTKMFGQSDHYKVFGKDFLYQLFNLNDVSVETILLENYSTMDTVFVLQK
jgi:hypothetical protein